MNYFTIFTSFLAASVTATALAQQFPPPITPTARVDLFNGKNLAGLTICLRDNAPAADTFAVSNGLLHCTGQPFGYIRTDNRYRDYKLTVEWRFVKVAERADNSGVFVHVQEPNHVWPQCIENQGQYHHQGDFIFLGGAKFKGKNGPAQGMVKKQGPPQERTAGEWNTYEIVCRGDTVKNYVNGELMNQVEGCSISSGAIALQSEGGEWELRRICVEPLPTAGP